jgi:hypothetical protein
VYVYNIETNFAIWFWCAAIGIMLASASSLHFHQSTSWNGQSSLATYGNETKLGHNWRTSGAPNFFLFGYSWVFWLPLQYLHMIYLTTPTVSTYDILDYPYSIYIWYIWLPLQYLHIEVIKYIICRYCRGNQIYHM